MPSTTLSTAFRRQTGRIVLHVTLLGRARTLKMRVMMQGHLAVLLLLLPHDRDRTRLAAHHVVVRMRVILRIPTRTQTHPGCLHLLCLLNEVSFPFCSDPRTFSLLEILGYIHLSLTDK